LEQLLSAQRSHIMDELTKASKTVEKQIAQTEKKIGDATLQAQNEFLKTLEEMNREVMSRMAAEVERGVKLSTKLSAARSLPDAAAAYQEWMSEEMNARSEDARRFMANSQKFMNTSTKFLSNGWSGVGMST
jgi:sugar-specific transcriptional regulator TrmB